LQKNSVSGVARSTFWGKGLIDFAKKSILGNRLSHFSRQFIQYLVDALFLPPAQKTSTSPGNAVTAARSRATGSENPIWIKYKFYQPNTEFENEINSYEFIFQNIFFYFPYSV
jgi:hypothetical protein